MKKLFFILLLFVAVHSALYAQEAVKGLSEEGYKNWIKAKVRMESIKQERDYYLVLNDFLEVLKTDSLFADTYFNLGIPRKKGKEISLMR